MSVVANQSRKPQSAADVHQYASPVDVLGIPITPETLSQALVRVDDAIRHGRRLDVGVVNAAKIVNMQKDSSLRQAVLSSDVIYADGMSVVWASRILNCPLPERVAGIDLMNGIMAQGSSRGYRVYCLGAKQEIVDVVVENFRATYPGAVICGSHHGYFDASGEQEVATAIRDARPDVLFVAITSPRKENFMAKWADLMNVPVVHGVGGSFDVVAGLVERAPPVWQRLGLEWLYRVKQEPRRLWRRYLVTNTAFLRMLVAAKVKSIVRSR